MAIVEIELWPFILPPERAWCDEHSLPHTIGLATFSVTQAGVERVEVATGCDVGVSDGLP